jgi:hypothetical protein
LTEPVGIRLHCEMCGEESVVAIPAAHARYGLLACPGCRTGYLVLLAAVRPAPLPAVAAGMRPAGQAVNAS